ncbi:carboxylesterase family protein [Nocardia sp. NPDC049707]|uniref:carboxylesterase/lipase family protein n=1 Tax=Nocardia sp. NPDC049707 TaxID=3154735 RepID=UPI00341FD122
MKTTAATSRGTVRGTADGEVVAFRGIPYAASPIDDLRFAPPRPHPGWQGIRETTQAGPAVPQAASRLELVMGHRTPDWNEDGCLTLNVYTPQTALDDESSRPVLVWFHGGGFTSGSGGWDWYDGTHLAALGDMVVVTANYRLGALGYLYLPEIGAENLGAQDQAAVLHWVRDNIGSFGGDPGHVTVGGQSAGAYSALSLALDPQTSGLITGALLQSGPWGLTPQDPQQAAAIAEEYLCLLDVPAGVASGKALRALPVEQLLVAYGQLAQQHARLGNVAPPMYPVLGAPGVPRAWHDSLMDGDLEGKALLIGTTQNEATAFFGFDPRIQNITAEGALDVVAGSQAQQTYQRYAAQHPDATPARIVTEIETDELFRNGTLQIADHHSAGGNPTFVYQFDYHPPTDEHALGATHCSELPFLFGTFDAYTDSPMLGKVGDTQHTLSKTFATAITMFVTADQIPDWLPYAPATPTRIRYFA